MINRFIQVWQHFDVNAKGILWPIYALLMIILISILERINVKSNRKIRQRKLF